MMPMIRLKTIFSIGRRDNGIDLMCKFGYLEFGNIQLVGAVIFTEPIMIYALLPEFELHLQIANLLISVVL